MIPTRALPRFFGRRQDRPHSDESYKEFVRGVLLGSDFEAKDWGDFCYFQQTTNAKVKKEHWKQWHARFQEDGSWAVVEKERWAYFKNGLRVEDWVSF